MNSEKVIGIGNTASVFEYEKDKVLKLFNQGYPYEAVEFEYRNAMAIREMNFAKPKAYEIVTYDTKIGIIYDRIDGENLLDRVIKTGDLNECATYMAKTHQEILQNKISDVINYKDFLKEQTKKAAITFEEQQETIHRIDNLPDGNTLCHGDFHPGNILISGDNAFVIDFMNICQGDFLYDVARTVYLVQYTPVSTEAKERDMLIQFKKTLADLYLEKMNVSRERIEEYLKVITIARKGECPDEQKTQI